MKPQKNQTKNDPTPRDYSIIYLCFGIVFFCIGLYFIQKIIHLHDNGIIITGVVVDYKLELEGYKVRDFTYYYNVDTTQGVFQLVIDDQVDIGSEVTFIYDPEDRDTMVILPKNENIKDYGINELIRISNTHFILILLWGTSLVSCTISGWYYKKHKTSVSDRSSHQR